MSELTVTRHGRVLQLTLNRPQARNALNNALLTQIADALESGKLAFYGADAFATEPLPPQSRLRSLPGAVLTPHIAWTTKEALQRLMDITTGNLRSFLAGKGENIVNP